MNEIERRIECLLEYNKSTKENDILEGVLSDDDKANSQIYGEQDQNTDTEQSMYSSSSDDNISNNSDSVYSYHESDDELSLFMNRTFYSEKDGAKWYQKLNVRVRVVNHNKVPEKLIGRQAKQY